MGFVPSLEDENMMKINIKKGATARDTILVLLGFIALFYVGFMFIFNLANDYNIQNVDPHVTAIIYNLSNSQDDIQNNVNDVQDFANSVTEASFGDFAYFGLKGILAVMKTPFQLVSIGSNTLSTVTSLFDFVPIQIKALLITSVVVVITFLGIKFLSSRGQEP